MKIILTFLLCVSHLTAAPAAKQSQKTIDAWIIFAHSCYEQKESAYSMDWKQPRPDKMLDDSAKKKAMAAAMIKCQNALQLLVDSGYLFRSSPEIEMNKWSQKQHIAYRKVMGNLTTKYGLVNALEMLGLGGEYAAKYGAKRPAKSILKLSLPKQEHQQVIEILKGEVPEIPQVSNGQPDSKDDPDSLKWVRFINATNEMHVLFSIIRKGDAPPANFAAVRDGFNKQRDAMVAAKLLQIKKYPFKMSELSKADQNKLRAQADKLRAKYGLLSIEMLNCGLAQIMTQFGDKKYLKSVNLGEQPLTIFLPTNEFNEVTKWLDTVKIAEGK